MHNTRVEIGAITEGNFEGVSLLSLADPIVL